MFNKKARKKRGTFFPLRTEERKKEREKVCALM